MIILFIHGVTVLFCSSVVVFIQNIQKFYPSYLKATDVDIDHLRPQVPKDRPGPEGQNNNCSCRIGGAGCTANAVWSNPNKRNNEHSPHLNNQARFDLEAWSEFINSFNGKSILLNDEWQNSEKLHTYTDAADSLGYGAVLGKKWFYGNWEEIQLQDYNITLRELFPIVVAIEICWKI